MKEKQRIIIYSILYAVSLTLLALIDWKVAAGAFLLLTAHHFEKH